MIPVKLTMSRYDEAQNDACGCYPTGGASTVLPHDTSAETLDAHIACQGKILSLINCFSIRCYQTSDLLSLSVSERYAFIPSTDRDFSLLRFKGRELALNVLPGLCTLDQSLESLQDLVLGGADLYCCVTLTQRHSAIVDRLEVYCDTKWRAQLVVAAVPLANARRRIVDTACNTQSPQSLRQITNNGLELVLG